MNFSGPAKKIIGTSDEPLLSHLRHCQTIHWIRLQLHDLKLAGRIKSIREISGLEAMGLKHFICQTA